MRRDVMIDLETLGLTPDAAIIAIGACEFDLKTGQIGGTVHAKIDWGTIPDSRVIDMDTVKWWMQRGDEARQIAVSGTEAYRNALHRLGELAEGATVWGNGATFDISMLENAYREQGMPVPWHFRNVRDVRTVVDLAAPFMVKEDVPFEGVRHDALSDAIWQAKYVAAMWKELQS